MPKAARMWVQGPQADLFTLDIRPAGGGAYRLTHVVVHNVGQGNGNAIYVEQEAKPILYFDVGCGGYFNANTCPAVLNYDFSNEPWIILSHWDFDHWFAGYYKKWDTASQCDWLAPRQKVGTNHQALASDLKNRLHLWPEPGAPGFRPKVETKIGEALVTIVRCTGDAATDMNNSGLAMKIVIGTKRVLLPGDAGYAVIPFDEMTASPWTGLVATHHGSRTHVLDMNDQPIPKMPRGTNDSVIVYSAADTKYGHPNALAKQGYEGRNWKNSKETKNAGDQTIPLGDDDQMVPC